MASLSDGPFSVCMVRVSTSAPQLALFGKKEGSGRSDSTYVILFVLLMTSRMMHDVYIIGHNHVSCPRVR